MAELERHFFVGWPGVKDRPCGRCGAAWDAPIHLPPGDVPELNRELERQAVRRQLSPRASTPK